MEGERLHGNPCSFECAVSTSTVSCSLLELHQLQLIRFGHLYHVIDVPMNSVGGLIKDYKSAAALHVGARV